MGIKMINRHGTSSIYRLEKTMKRITKENIIIVITIIIGIISTVFFLSVIEQKNKSKKHDKFKYEPATLFNAELSELKETGEEQRYNILIGKTHYGKPRKLETKRK